jgi:hypothetical protein
LILTIAPGPPVFAEDLPVLGMHHLLHFVRQTERDKEVVMNSIDYRKGMKTKLVGWKEKMNDLTRKVARRGSKESEKVLRKNQDLEMPNSEMSSRIEQFDSERPTEWASQMKNTDNGLVAMRGKYVLRPRLSWTGLYGKEPWPRERKQWEKV